MFEPFKDDGETPYDSTRWTAGYDLKFKDQDTLLLRDYCIDLMIEGYKTQYIALCLTNELGWKRRYSDNFVAKCYKELQKNKEIDPEVIRSANYKRLLHLYEQSVQSGNMKAAISALSEINKLYSLNTQKVEVTTNEYQLNFDNGEN